MTHINRRNFVQRSAATAVGIAASSLLPDSAHAEGAGHTAASVADAKAQRNDRVRARPVPLDKVRLTGGPLLKAQQSAANYLLSLNPDRMMAFYRVRAGLVQKAQPYDGWDGPGKNLTGHIAGHHLSGVSLMYLATGDARFKQRADYLVRELDEVQKKHGDGYLSALENGREVWAQVSKGDIRSAAFDLNGLWSPWYTLHKTFAGLRDAYRHTGNKTALDVERRFAEWAKHTLDPLSEAQFQKMLNTEHGGMNEVLVDLWVDTGDTRWLDFSRRFEHHAFTDALKRHQDNLPGKHGNCQIPKLIGSAARYEHTGDADDFVAASFFFDRVAQHHTYASGGHGLDEYFGFPDQLSHRVDGRTCETCNVYNMVKLARRLFSFRPDSTYADFHEKALFNHALASFDPDGVRMSYMVPVGRAVQQEYQDMEKDFTCCVGTGMENHALHGDGIFYESDDTVWLNIFAPATAELSNGVKIAMDSSFPDGDSAKLTLNVPRNAKPFTLAIRRPGWAGDGFTVKVNGESVAVPSLASMRVGGGGGRDVGLEETTSSYVRVERAWKSGDVVDVAIPKSIRLEPTPDDKSVAAVMWGPIVLVGDLAPRRDGRNAPRVEAPVLVTDRPVAEWIKPTNVARLYSSPTAAPGDVSLKPFYRTHGRTYGLYFDVLAPADFTTRVAARANDAERLKKLEAASIAVVLPGDGASESAAVFKSEPADRNVVRTQNRTARAGTGWFSYDLPVDPNVDVAVVVTYFNDLGLPSSGNFEILVDGTSIGHYQPNRNANGFWTENYHVPLSLTRDKAKVTVRIQAANGGRIAPIYGIRMVREKDLQ
jgi:DUF1680 family protein